MKKVHLTNDIRVNFDDFCSYRQFLKTEQSFISHFDYRHIPKKDRIIISLLAMAWTYEKIRKRSGISNRQIRKVVVKYNLQPLTRRYAKNEKEKKT